MKYDLTEKDLRYIFGIAHKEWLEGSSLAYRSDHPDEYLLARAYFKAVTSFLVSKGYTIESKHDEKQDKG